MPLTFHLDLALSKTAGRKGGDEAGRKNNHRVASKPCKSVMNIIADSVGLYAVSDLSL
jgi:hypothetical protein